MSDSSHVSPGLAATTLSSPQLSPRLLTCLANTSYAGRRLRPGSRALLWAPPNLERSPREPAAAPGRPAPGPGHARGPGVQSGPPTEAREKGPALTSRQRRRDSPPENGQAPVTHQVPDAIPRVIHEREDEGELGRVDQSWPQTQGLHELQMRLKVPREQKGRQAKKGDP